MGDGDGEGEETVELLKDGRALWMEATELRTVNASEVRRGGRGGGVNAMEKGRIAVGLAVLFFKGEAAGSALSQESTVGGPEGRAGSGGGNSIISCAW